MSNANSKKWFLPYRATKVNYEDIGAFPLLLQHDRGFSGRKIYRLVRYFDGRFIFVSPYGMTRKEAIAALKVAQ